MKHFYLAALGLAMGIASANADETVVKELYSGEPVNVTWENTMSFAASEFADVNVGDYIYITFTATTDVIELKSDGTWLPGTRFSWLGDGVPDYKSYITADGLEYLQEFGLELCGANFTVGSVSVCNDGFVMPEGAVWGGFFWVSDWNTLEVWKTAFANYNGEKYMVINISEDNGDNTEYVMQVMTAFDNPDAVIANADKGNETKAPSMTVIDLSDVNLTALLENADRVLVQGNPESGNPFNITSIVLTNTNPLDSDSVAGIEESGNTSVDVYNLQGVLVKKGVDKANALNGLPKGIYLLKGETSSKKVVK